MVFRSIISGLGFALAFSAPLAAKTYTCEFTKQGHTNSIPYSVIIQHDETSGAVTVNDPFIQNYVGSPVAGTLKSLNATRALFSWMLPGLKDANGNWVPGVAFSVNIILATGEASISSNPSGDYLSQRGTGSCTSQ